MRRGSRIWLVLVACLLGTLAMPARADVMTLPLYTLGGYDTVMAALNGAAMIFGTPLFNSSSFGIGQVVGTGLLFSFLIMTMTGVIEQRISVDRLLMLLVAYAAMFGPTMTVTVVDLQAGRSANVGNVPLGIGFPATVTSALAQVATDKLVTAYTPVTATGVQNYDVREGGFISPLKAMLLMRSAVTCDYDPTLCKTQAKFARDCSQDSLGNSINWTNGLQTPDAVGNIYQTQASSILGTTFEYTQANPSGVALSCSDAGAHIATRWQNVVNSPNGLLSNILGANASGVRTLAQSTLTPQQLTADAIQMAVGSSVFSVNQIMNNMLACKPTAASEAAAGEATFQDSYTFMTTEAMEQWKITATADADIWTKTVFTVINILIFLFICLTPIVLMVAVAMGTSGLKLLAKHALFGAWTQTWLPVAAVINAYTLTDFQSRLKDFLASIGQPDPAYAFSCINLNAFYNQMSTALASASSMLTASGTISLAILTGSTFALAGIASRGATGGGHVDGHTWAGSATGSTNADGLFKSAQAAGMNYAGPGSQFGEVAQPARVQAEAAGSISLGTASSRSGGHRFGLDASSEEGVEIASGIDNRSTASLSEDGKKGTKVQGSTRASRREGVAATLAEQGFSKVGQHAGQIVDAFSKSDLNIGGKVGVGLGADGRASLLQQIPITPATANSPAGKQIASNLAAGKIAPEHAAAALAMVDATPELGASAEGALAAGERLLRTRSGSNSIRADAGVGAGGSMGIGARRGNSAGKEWNNGTGQTGTGEETLGASLEKMREAGWFNDYSTNARMAGEHSLSSAMRGKDGDSVRATGSTFSGDSLEQGVGNKMAINKKEWLALLSNPEKGGHAAALDGAFVAASNELGRKDDNGKGLMHPTDQKNFGNGMRKASSEGGLLGVMNFASRALSDSRPEFRAAGANVLASLARQAGYTEGASFLEDQRNAARREQTPEGSLTNPSSAEANVRSKVPDVSDPKGRLDPTGSLGGAESSAAAAGKKAESDAPARVRQAKAETNYGAQSKATANAYEGDKPEVVQQGQANVGQAKAVPGVATTIEQTDQSIRNSQPGQAARAAEEMTSVFGTVAEVAQRGLDVIQGTDSKHHESPIKASPSLSDKPVEPSTAAGLVDKISDSVNKLLGGDDKGNK